MHKSLKAIKLGITQYFDEQGRSHAVTALQVYPHHILEKAPSGDFLVAVEGAASKRRLSNNSYVGILKKNNVSLEKKPIIAEITKFHSSIDTGATITADVFKVGDIVDVTGITKGKGFSGVVKLYKFAGQPASHGNSKTTRKPGSTGQQDAGRVFKGKRMPKKAGCYVRTQKGLEVVSINDDVILVKGSVPGVKKSNVSIEPTKIGRRIKNNFLVF